PDHAAVLEGAQEVPVWGDDALTVVQGRIPLRVRPQSFLQTNTPVASELYEQVAMWVDQAEAEAAAPPTEAAAPLTEPTAPLTEPTAPLTEAADGCRARSAASPAPFVVWDLFCGVGG